VKSEAKDQPALVAGNTEVKASKAPRRVHTAAFKLRILKEADACRSQAGAVSALLRREGLYSSLLCQWRGQRESGALSSFSQKRGRKVVKTALDHEKTRLQNENLRLEKSLRQAMLIIEAQKKIAEILGTPITSSIEKVS
jgi:transposase